MHRLGCSTWCLMDMGLFEALEILSERTDTIEILSDARHDLLYESESCASFNLSYTVHSPTTDINIASCRETLRNASIDLLQEVCQKAGEIGARCVVVHPGFSPWLEMHDKSYDALRRSLVDLAVVQEEHGVPVAIENMGSWEVCHFRNPSVLPVLEEAGLSFCLDIGHAHINGVLDDFLALATPDHIHLHDNRGSFDDHGALGTGTMDLEHIIPRLPRNSCWIMEVKAIDDFDESMRYMERRE
ncbi:MAG: sugar phosphate isomerase/epimerase family protein [Methanoregulaceae archaeon]|nr:sugar phosphate isomerase/epimerase [Methanoregulaceae archaeon]MDD5049200.1 sugar phosphate isomerase/epimerase [Methanoregulaceae archaeon]MDD5685950.1 sugar phosphate isomerase/epimerase [Methanoregulaceae archaeon]